MFKDKVYDDMDDVSRLFEPFQFDLNDELAKFPDKVEVEPEAILIDKYWGGYGTTIMNVVEKEARKLDLVEILINASLLNHNNFFKFQVEGLEDGETLQLDATSMTMSHKIFLVKAKVGFDEQTLETMRKEKTISFIKHGLSRRREVSKVRLNEIADIYSANEVKSDRSSHGKVNKFCDHLSQMIDDKTLDIRDMGLVKKFAEWVVCYVKDGNLAALNNLTRIKIITHEKRPIYSIEEKEV